MTATAAPPATVDASASSLRLVFALARFEGRKMVTHPVVWIGGLASGALAVFELVEEAPVLNRVSMTLAWTMAPLALAVALVAGSATLRARGRTDAHPPTVMPAAMASRVEGILIGVAWPALATVVMQLAVLAWVTTRDPVTSLVWTELLVGPLYVMFAGSLSVALNRWMPHGATSLFTVFLLAGLQIVVPYDPGQWGARIGPAALAPIAWPEDIIPYEVSFRPSSLHLGYLAGLALVVAGLAVLGRRITGWTLVVVGAVLASTLGVFQLGPIEEGRRLEAMNRLVGDQADLICETHDGIRYCAMPGYQGWIDDWQEAAQLVLDAAPTEALKETEIRQYPVHNTHMLEGQSFNDWWWIGPAYQDYANREVVPVGSVLASWSSSEVSRQLGSRIVGCDISRGCEVGSQQVIYLWLLAHDPEIRSYVVYDAEESDYVGVSDCMVAEMWDRADTGDRIRANWELLVDPTTTYEEAGVILGVSVPTGYNETGHIEEGGCR